MFWIETNRKNEYKSKQQTANNSSLSLKLSKGFQPFSNIFFSFQRQNFEVSDENCALRWREKFLSVMFEWSSLTRQLLARINGSSVNRRGESIHNRFHRKTQKHSRIGYNLLNFIHQSWNWVKTLCSWSFKLINKSCWELTGSKKLLIESFEE